MALKTRSVETKAVTDLAALAVFTASKDGGMIAADVEARRLLDENPNCQIPSRSCGTPSRQSAQDREGVQAGRRLMTALAALAHPVRRGASERRPFPSRFNSAAPLRGRDAMLRGNRRLKPAEM